VAIELLGGKIGSKEPVHPNDDVNMGQSSKDTFPTAWMDVVKTGRIHLMDAVPLTVGQEWSGWAHQIRDTLAHIRFEFAAGATVVGAGLSAPSNFGREIAELTGYPFATAPNKFAAQGSLDGTVAAMARCGGSPSR
jgi:fumarate hydratase class II